MELYKKILALDTDKDALSLSFDKPVYINDANLGVYQALFQEMANNWPLLVYEDAKMPVEFDLSVSDLGSVTDAPNILFTGALASPCYIEGGVIKSLATGADVTSQVSGKVHGMSVMIFTAPPAPQEPGR